MKASAKDEEVTFKTDVAELIRQPANLGISSPGSLESVGFVMGSI